MSARYWRLTCYTGTPATALFVRNIELHATVSGADQCEGGTPTASREDGVNVASRAFDSPLSTTYWVPVSSGISLASDATSGDWIQYDFGAGNDKSVDEIVWTHTANLSQIITGIKIWFSDDAVSWTLRDTVTGLTTGVNTRSLVEEVVVVSVTGITTGAFVPILFVGDYPQFPGLTTGATVGTVEVFLNFVEIPGITAGAEIGTITSTQIIDAPGITTGVHVPILFVGDYPEFPGITTGVEVGTVEVYAIVDWPGITPGVFVPIHFVGDYPGWSGITTGAFLPIPFVGDYPQWPGIDIGAATGTVEITLIIDVSGITTGVHVPILFVGDSPQFPGITAGAFLPIPFVGDYPQWPGITTGVTFGKVVISLIPIFQPDTHTIFLAKLTGSQNAQPELDLSPYLISFSARKVNAESGSLSIVVGRADLLASEMALRPDGDLVVYIAQVKRSGEFTGLAELWAVNWNSLSTNVSLQGHTAVLAGYRQKTNQNPKTIYLTHVNNRSVRDGKITLQSPRIPFNIDAGDQIIYNGDIFTSGTVTYNVSVGQQQFTVTEA